MCLGGQNTSWDASLDTGQIAAKQSGCHGLRTTKKAWFRYGQSM